VRRAATAPRRLIEHPSFARSFFTLSLSPSLTSHTHTHVWQRRVRPPKIGYKAGEDGEVQSTFELSQSKPNALLPVLLGGNPATSYSIAPRLPAGLWLDTKSGVISGQPQVAMPAPQQFTVTAANEAGFSDAPLQLVIVPEPPVLHYPGDLRATVGQPCSLVPRGESVVDAYAIEGTLPAGIVFDTKTGRFSGTPDKVRQQALLRAALGSGGGR
jgi:hypothetical protein